MILRSITTALLISVLMACSSDEGWPSSELTSTTKCAGIDLTEVVLGYQGEYAFKEGANTETRTGLIKRTKGEARDCILPSLAPMQSMYAEVNKKKFKAIKGSWKMQCTKSAAPGKPIVNDSQLSRSISSFSGKAMMLHCGHNVEGVETCETGSNSNRSRAWKKGLDKRGNMMLAIHAPLVYQGSKEGEKVYCEYYNAKSQKSLFAFEYLSQDQETFNKSKK